MANPVILWLRQDLRLHDQPALVAAAGEGPVIPVYVLDDETPGDWRIGGAQRWWLHHSLYALDQSLRGRGSRLILRRGKAAEVISKLLEETGASRVHAVRHYEPWWREAEVALGERVCLHDGNHLARVEEVTTGSGGQFRIFSSFYKALQPYLPPDDPLDAPDHIPAPIKWPSSDTLAEWNLRPNAPDWSDGFKVWKPGETAGREALKDFTARVREYENDRNRPSLNGSSRLSPHLHFGEVSPRAAWHATRGRSAGAQSFMRELAWRDFTDGVIMALPRYGNENARPKYDQLPWRADAAATRDLKAWQRGRTGYPIVDAGMRQLWTTGWIHNRVRMITASFLIKHLLIDWREGERWYWDCLVDANYGNNSVNWQWVAGTGVDANMFSRIMAPLLQSEKFDAATYIRQYVPELSDLPDAAIHDPDAAGCRPGNYPAKIIGHREGRERALAAAATLT